MANPQIYYDILQKPLMTEKSTVLGGLRNQYFFRVASSATKPEIRKAIEAVFEVKVLGVKTLNVPGRMRRVLGRPGFAAGWKKAIVTLAAGQTIDLT